MLRFEIVASLVLQKPAAIANTGVVHTRWSERIH